MKAPDYLTVAQAAELRGVSASAVRAWVASGLLPHVVATGRLYLLRRADVERFKPPMRGRPKRR